jgi:hypothetical protein
MKGRFHILSACGLAAALAYTNAQTPSSGPPKSPRAAAPIDLTGYWVSVVTEDWRFRMIVPDKGDYASVPLNTEGRQVANSWDPLKDEATGSACRSYGAPAIMRVPGRLHVFWEDEATLRIDTDSGKQTRRLHFGGSAPESGDPTWQGYSAADWEGMRVGLRNPYMGQHGGPEQAEGYLKVVTTRMRSGYLRKNGVPYSAEAVLEEYFDSFRELNGDTWLVVTTIVKNPQYLLRPFVTSSHFKKLASASGWDPTECHADQPR